MFMDADDDSVNGVSIVLNVINDKADPLFETVGLVGSDSRTGTWDVQTSYLHTVLKPWEAKILGWDDGSWNVKLKLPRHFTLDFRLFMVNTYSALVLDEEHMIRTLNIGEHPMLVNITYGRDGIQTWALPAVLDKPYKSLTEMTNCYFGSYDDVMNDGTVYNSTRACQTDKIQVRNVRCQTGKHVRSQTVRVSLKNDGCQTNSQARTDFWCQNDDSSPVQAARCHTSQTQTPGRRLACQLTGRQDCCKPRGRPMSRSPRMSRRSRAPDNYSDRRPLLNTRRQSEGINNDKMMHVAMVLAGTSALLFSMYKFLS